MFLKKEDIDLEKGMILVRHKEGFKPKTDRPRVIPIHPELLPILRLLWSFRFRNDGGNGDFVFINSRGKPFSNDTIRQKLKKLCKKIGIKPGKLHISGILGLLILL